MSPNELEVALIKQGIAQPDVKRIVAMAFSLKIERHQKGWLIPVSELSGSVWSKRTQQRLIEDLRSLMEAGIVVDEELQVRKFPVVASAAQAQDSQFILYSFSSEFREWAGLPIAAVAPVALH